jgi:hypothetical protein
MRGLLLTALGLLLPSLLARVAIPGINLDGFRAAVGFEEPLPSTMTLAAVLNVPWVTAALFVHALAWLVPAWRRARRTGRVAQLSWLAGLLVLVTQVFGLALYLRHEDMVLNESWAPWLIGACLVAASLGARGLAALISRRGVGDGMSVLIAGELLLKLAERVRQLSIQSEWHGEQEPTLGVPLALAGTLALTLWLSGWVSPRLRARWSVMPMISPSGLVPAGLAAALLAPFEASGTPGSLAALRAPWMRSVDLLFGMPLQVPLPADSALALGATALLCVVVAALVTRRHRLEAILASLNIGRAEGRSWFRVATFANAAWLILIVRAAALTGTQSLVPWLLVTAFVLHDVWMEAQLKARGAAVAVAQLTSVVTARGASHLLAAAGIPHALRGMGLRALFHGFAPFTQLALWVGEADAERAAAELAPLLEVERGRPP